MGFSYSFFAVKKGQSRPSVWIFQLACTELARVLSKPEWVLGADGIAGVKTERVIKLIQEHYGLGADGSAGSKTWGAMTDDLGAWRPPLRFRIAELQNTFENGGTAECFGACNMVSFEGWNNYSVWNVNWPNGDLGGSSLGIILKMAGRTDLYAAAKAKNNAELIDFFRSKEGRDVQLNGYMDKFILAPAAKWLADSGFPGFDLDVANFRSDCSPCRPTLRLTPGPRVTLRSGCLVVGTASVLSSGTRYFQTVMVVVPFSVRFSESSCQKTQRMILTIVWIPAPPICRRLSVVSGKCVLMMSSGLT
jgi:hypothetical protein